MEQALRRNPTGFVLKDKAEGKGSLAMETLSPSRPGGDECREADCPQQAGGTAGSSLSHSHFAFPSRPSSSSFLFPSSPLPLPFPSSSSFSLPTPPNPTMQSIPSRYQRTGGGYNWGQNAPQRPQNPQAVPPWKLWDSVAVGLRNVPNEATALILWQAFSREGNVCSVDLYEDEHGNRGTRGKVRFRFVLSLLSLAFTSLT